MARQGIVMAFVLLLQSFFAFSYNKPATLLIEIAGVSIDYEEFMEEGLREAINKSYKIYLSYDLPVPSPEEIQKDVARKVGEYVSAMYTFREEALQARILMLIYMPSEGIEGMIEKERFYAYWVNRR